MSRRALLKVLEHHDVRCVVIGGYAAVLHGWRGVTDDVDITPEGSPENLDRLAAALTELGARARVDGYPDGFRLPGGIAAATFKDATSLAFVTKHGNLHVALRPDGTQGYADLARNAQPHELDGEKLTGGPRGRHPRSCQPASAISRSAKRRAASTSRRASSRSSAGVPTGGSS